MGKNEVKEKAGKGSRQPRKRKGKRIADWNGRR
jgi:hypothetical protein